MNSLSKNLIIFFLVACIVVIFSFHWFFVGNMMTVSDCLSPDCAYSSATTTIPPQTMDILLIALLAILIAVILPLAIPLLNRFIEMPNHGFLKWKIDGFCRKLISWLKILEKRDPQTALIAVRISDFRQ